jgi:hypothetical protein
VVEFRPELGFRAEQGREFYNSDQIIELIVAKSVILAFAVLELVQTAVQLDTTIICLFVAIQSNLHPKPRLHWHRINPHKISIFLIVCHEGASATGTKTGSTPQLALPEAPKAGQNGR